MDECMKKSNESNNDDTKSEKLNYTKNQEAILNRFVIPDKLYIRSASEFDDKWISPINSRWEFRFSGENVVLDFGKNIHLKKHDFYGQKLIKLILIKYINEHSAARIDSLAFALAETLSSLNTLSHETVILYLQDKVDEGKFYFVLYSLRKLEQLDFFIDTNREQDLEEKLIFIPRPFNSGWDVYREYGNIIPKHICAMIENGIVEYSERIKIEIDDSYPLFDGNYDSNFNEKLIQINDCIILGLSYYTGARPVQLSKLSFSDILVDATSMGITRYSISLPYAKKVKLHIDRIMIAIPKELGDIILYYQRMTKSDLGSPLIPQRLDAVIIVNQAIEKQLLKFSPKETQEAVNLGVAEISTYTSSSFRHNVGHSMAMSGASAEEIAYILGHTNTVVASHYISATPNLSDIREQALGTNPVFKNMVALMMTGNFVNSKIWRCRRVAGCIDGKLYHKIGGCSYDEQLCPFSQVRACYGCLYFKPFIDGNHSDVFDSFNNELISLMHLSNDTNEVHHPLITEITRRKHQVMMVITRLSLFHKNGRNFNA